MPLEIWIAHVPLTTSIFTPLTADIWRNEKIPDNFREGLIIKIPKKVNLHKLIDWRGFTLLNMTNKIIVNILYDCIWTSLEPGLRSEQAGLIPNKSCADHINSIGVIVHTCIYFTLAFSEHWQRTSIWEALRCKGVPETLICLIMKFYNKACYLILHERSTNNPIRANVGVHQCCVLSQSRTKQHGITWVLNNKLNDFDYADDVSLLSHSFSSMHSSCKSWLTS